MDDRALLNRIRTFEGIKQLKTNQHKKFLNNCPDQCIDTICEACYNILHESLKIPKDKKCRLKKKLKPIRMDVRKLADPKLSVSAKRQILRKPQVGRGIFTVLATTVLPTTLLSK
jgi:hypothetical protein